MAVKSKSDGERLVEIHTRQEYAAKALDTLQTDMKEQTKVLVAALQTHAADDTNRFEKHDSRLKILEQLRWYIMGALAIMGVVGWYLKGG